MAIRRASRLRHRITIERRAIDYDELGHEQAEWVQVGSFFAEVNESAGRELERARQLVGEATIAITIRYQPGITSKDRVRFRDRVIQIGGVVDPDQKKRELLIAGVEAL